MAAPKEPVLKKGEVINNRFRIEKLLGVGTFVQVYIAHDTQKNSTVCVKVETFGTSNTVLPDERIVLKEIKAKTDNDSRETPHFCSMIASGSTEKYNFLATTLCGPSLDMLKKKSPNGYFSIGTVCEIGIQVLEAVEMLHTAGYLHRNIKPANFVIGPPGRFQRSIFMVDFGIAREHAKLGKADEKAKHVPQRPGSRETRKYRSISADLKRDPSKSDDIWSIFYMLVEFARGYLPWDQVKLESEGLHAKRKIPPINLIKDFPPDFVTFVDHLSSLGFAYLLFSINY